MKNTSLDLLHSATKSLRAVMEVNAGLRKKVRRALRKPSYTINTIFGKQCQSLLLAFFGATGGHGIILLKDYRGEPIFWVSCPTLNRKFDTSDNIDRKLWPGKGPLPVLVRKELKKLRRLRGVENLLCHGLRSA